jgi:hypothetical protein
MVLRGKVRGPQKRWRHADLQHGKWANFQLSTDLISAFKPSPVNHQCWEPQYYLGPWHRGPILYRVCSSHLFTTPHPTECAVYLANQICLPRVHTPPDRPGSQDPRIPCIQHSMPTTRVYIGFLPGSILLGNDGAISVSNSWPAGWQEKLVVGREAGKPAGQLSQGLHFSVGAQRGQEFTLPTCEGCAVMYILFFFVALLGFELRTLNLHTRRYLSHTSCPFCSG